MQVILSGCDCLLHGVLSFLEQECQPAWLRRFVPHSRAYLVAQMVKGEGNGSPLQYSCLENPVDRGAWWAAVHRVAQSRTRLKQLSSSSSLVCNWLKS